MNQNGTKHYSVPGSFETLCGIAYGKRFATKVSKSKDGVTCKRCKAKL